MKKGFTLVELLAVIVILAIIALVTTPAILNVITDSRKSGAEDKAWGVMKSVEYAYSEAQYKGQSIPLPYTHDFSKTNNQLTVNVQGEKPTEGTVTISATGQLSSVGLKFQKNGTYYCSSNTNGTKMCCSSSPKTNAECDAESSSSGGSSGGGSAPEPIWTPGYYEYHTGNSNSVTYGNSYDTSLWTTDPTTLNKNYYLGHDVTITSGTTGTVIANYACFILDNTQYCLRAQDGSSGTNYFTQNKALLSALEAANKITCSQLDDSGANCSGGNLNGIYAYPNGYVEAEVGNHNCNCYFGGSYCLTRNQ